MSLTRALAECIKTCLKKPETKRGVPPPFGHEMREQEFVLEEGIEILNNGSTGMVPRRLKEAQERYVFWKKHMRGMWFEGTTEELGGLKEAYER